jgi:FSR family fosmidomycin resistance protein-like MFS transporter
VSRTSSTEAVGGTPSEERRRTLLIASGAHILHDGYADLLYLLLPVWRAEFLLGYAEVGLLRALYAGAMAGFQVPAGALSARFGGRLVLTLGTALAATGFLIAGMGGGIYGLGLALLIGGIGASTQHPIASSLVARAFDGPQSRIALGTYNFAGDLGKVAFPALTAGLLALMAWRSAVSVLAAVGLVGAAAIFLLLTKRIARDAAAVRAEGKPQPSGGNPRGGFALLFWIGVIDTATRMGFLTFLPFLLAAKGASLSTVGMALTLVFAGGAAGKLACGYLGAHLGVLRTVYLTEGLTAAGIVALLPLPLEAALAILPLIGIALNGTSSVLYGTVPELVRPEQQERAFGLFYTGTVGGGAISPVIYGLFSDALGVPAMMVLIASIVMLTLPLAWLLNPSLAQPASGSSPHT